MIWAVTPGEVGAFGLGFVGAAFFILIVFPPQSRQENRIRRLHLKIEELRLKKDLLREEGRGSELGPPPGYYAGRDNPNHPG